MIRETRFVWTGYKGPKRGFHCGISIIQRIFFHFKEHFMEWKDSMDVKVLHGTINSNKEPLVFKCLSNSQCLCVSIIGKHAQYVCVHKPKHSWLASAHTYTVIQDVIYWLGLGAALLQYYRQRTLLWLGHLAAECGVTLPDTNPTPRM